MIARQQSRGHTHRMDMDVIRRNVAILRLARGWDQKELADRAEVSRSYVSRLEQGKTRQPRASELIQLAFALGLRVDQLAWRMRIELDPPDAAPDRPVSISAYDS